MNSSRTRGPWWARAFGEGMVAGLAGVTVMTLGEKAEQHMTGRLSSYVPARTMERVLGMREANGTRAIARNWVMHAGQGVLLGGLRGVMASAGLRGMWTSGAHWVVRLVNDQTLENATGVGAPPRTWPRKELLIDLVHKAVYAIATGAVADALAARKGPGPGQMHAQLRPGGHADVGPPTRAAVRERLRKR